MRLLLDTNVVVHLEDPSSPLEGPASELARLAHAHRVGMHVHPLVVEDFERDPDPDRKAISVSKAAKYPSLANPPNPDREFLALAGNIGSDNDRVDVAMLYALAQQHASLLVTEDRGVHKRAARAGLSERVYYVQQAVDALRSLFEPTVALPPKVENIEMNQLGLENEFFQSLIDDYGEEFAPWFRRGQQEGRRAWVIRDGLEVHGVCIYKPEDPETKRVLKICTFKVAESHYGQHLGELLLKTTFGFCAKNDFASAYVEVLPKQEFLIDFLHRFGFEYVGLKSGTQQDEGVYTKTFRPSEICEDALAYHVAYAPALPPNPRAFFVPVQPQYHDQLFPDALPAREQQMQLWADEEQSAHPSATVGNAIRKAYLCHAPITKLQPGDVLAFYRSHDLRAFTTCAVVERVERLSDPDQIAALVGKRTVYAYKDIRQMAQKPVLAIVFRQAMHFPEPVKWASLDDGFPSRAWQSITELTPDATTNLLERLRVDTA